MSGGERLGGCHKGAGHGRRRCSQCRQLAIERAHPTAGEGERAGWGGRPGPRAAEPAALLPLPLPPEALEQRGLRTQRRQAAPALLPETSAGRLRQVTASTAPPAGRDASPDLSPIPVLLRLWSQLLLEEPGCAGDSGACSRAAPRISQCH